MAYKMTAADRRALANIQARERQAQAKRNIVPNSQTPVVAKNKTTNPLLRGVATLRDLGENVNRGAYKGVEGIVDFGAGLVGAVGGLFSDDFENDVKKFIETDWTGKYFDEINTGATAALQAIISGDLIGTAISAVGNHHISKAGLSDHSYLKEGGMVEQVAQGVGQMLPAVAIGLATGGLGAGAAGGAAAGTSGGIGAALSTAAKTVGTAAAKNAGMLTLGASAAGGGTEEAFRDGASYGRGLGYGVVTGLTEMATEKLLPGPADNVIGKSLLGGVRKGVATQGVKRVVGQVAKEALGEATEEMVSEITNPLRKSIYKGVEAFEEYVDPEFYKGVGEAGLVGALTSMAYGGTVGAATKQGGKGYNGDIDASVEAIKALDEKRSKIQERDGKISSEDNERINKLIDENYKQIERVLKAKGVENMSDTIERYGLESNFDEGGNYVRDTMDTAGLDGAYYSANARGQEVSIREVLDEQGVTAYKGELTADETEAWKETLKAHNALNKLGYIGKKLVVVDEMSNNNAFISDDVIVIGKDMLTNGEHIKRLVHETTHFTEGSNEWKSLAKYVLGKGSDIKVRLKAEIDEIIGHGYGITDADVDALAKYIDGGYKGKLTSKQRTLAEELIANRMGNIFSDNAAVEHLCREKPKLAKRIWERIKAIVDSFGKSSSEREEIKKLRETERMFREALETGGQEYISKQMKNALGVDNGGEVQRAGKSEQSLSDVYDYSKSFAEQIDDYEKGEFPKQDTFVVSGTPDVFQSIGLPALPFTYTQRHLRENLEGDQDHHVSKTTLKKVPEALENPVAIIASRNPVGRVVAIVDLKSKNGRSVIAAIEISGYGQMRDKLIDSNAITSIHLRANAITGLLNDAVRENDRGKATVFYIQKEKAIALLKSSPVKFRGGESLTDGFNHSISENSDFVNSKFLKQTETLQFKRWFGKSKVVNDDGTPRVLYHQTGAEITEFDPRHKGAGTNDDETPFGIFMKPHDGDIGLSGKTQMALFARIVNPMTVNDREELVKRLKRFSPKYSEMLLEREKLNAEYEEKIEKAAQDWNRYAKEFRANNPDAPKDALYGDEKFMELYDAEDALTDEWTEEADKLALKMKEEITSVLKEKGFDGVIIKKDAGSGGRSVETYIALDPTQVKSATDNIGTFDRHNPNIKRSGKTDGDGGETPKAFADVDENPDWLDVEAEFKRIGEVFAEARNAREKVLRELRDEYLRLRTELVNSEYTGEFNEPAPNATPYELIEFLRKENRRLTTELEGLTKSEEAETETAEATAANSSWESTRSIANRSNDRVYTRKDAAKMVNDIIEECLHYDGGTPILRNRGEIADLIYRNFNLYGKAGRAKFLKTIADAIIKNTEVEYYDPNQEALTELKETLKPYLHSMSLSSIWDEMVHRYGKEKARNLRLLWGKTDGLAPDEIAAELESNGFPIHYDNPADIFFEIANEYDRASYGLSLMGPMKLSDSLDSEGRKEMRNVIANRLFRAFDVFGEPSAFAREVAEREQKTEQKAAGEVHAATMRAEQAESRAREEVLKEQAMRFAAENDTAEAKQRAKDVQAKMRKRMSDITERNRVANSVLYKVDRFRHLKLGTYNNATQPKADIFNQTIAKLGKIKNRGNLNESGTRGIIAELLEWYRKDNPMLMATAESNGYFNEEIAQLMDIIANGDGKLSTGDLINLEQVVDYFANFVKVYKKVLRNGKYVDAEPIAKKYVERLQKLKRENPGAFKRFFEGYVTHFGDPMAVMRYMDGYENGFFTEMLENLRRGAIDAAVMEMEIRAPLEKFYEKHKDFRKKLANKKVNYLGVDIPAWQAMLVCMSLNRDQAIMGLARSGFAYIDEKGNTIDVSGFEMDENVTETEVKERAKLVRKELLDRFTDTEREFLTIAENIFNNDCKLAKYNTDMKIYGYSNILVGFYVPVRRYAMGQSVDAESTYKDEMNRIANASFNKDTVQGARGKLFIESLEVVLNRHVKAVSMYANLAIPIREYDLLRNLDVGGNPNIPLNVNTESMNVWKDSQKYFQKIIKDVQGLREEQDWVSKGAGYIRGKVAVSALALNIKVLMTQFTSFAAAVNILDADCIAKSVTVSGKEVDKYCSLAKLRNHENTAALAQSVLDKVDKVGDVLMKPVGAMDRVVVTKLFGACQIQVEKNGGAKVGTVENKTEAGKLLERVILETQQNALATERSRAMRSDNEVNKTLTMFTADAVKGIGRLMDGLGEVTVLKAQLKKATDPAEIASLKKRIKAANGKAGRAIGAIVTQAVLGALLTELFKLWYGKEKEEDPAKIVWNMSVDAFGNLFGGLPIAKEILSFFMNGFDFESHAFTAFSDIASSVAGIYKALASDDPASKMPNALKNLAFAAGQCTGMPVRNVYNFVVGNIKLFSPEAGYAIDDFFYSQNYRADLAKAIEKGDDGMVATIAGLMMDDSSVGDFSDATMRRSVDKLVRGGFDVLPRAVGESVTYEGEAIALTKRQQNRFKSLYSVANDRVAKLVRLGLYKKATPEAQAKAVRFIYDTYYNLALQEVIGEDLENKNVLFAEAMDIEQLAIIVAYARSIEADTDRSGKPIAGSKKAKIERYIQSLGISAAEKYMMMGYLGYKCSNGASAVKGYINRLPLTKAEKERLYEYCGYAA